MKNLLFSLFLVFSTSFIFSQSVKNEVEKRIKKEEMPTQARDLLEKMPVPLKKAKYYIEKDNDHTSFEAKLKFQQKKYSIEFDEQGELHDVEVIIDFKEIPENVAKTIKNYLKTAYERHKIEKIQQQFLPSNTTDAFKNRKNPDNYELVVATKDKKNKLEKSEILFNAEGDQLETRKIIRRSYDFLLF